MKIIKSLIAVAALVFSTASIAASCADTNPLGQPKSEIKLMPICHTGYSVGYNASYLTPGWVAENLTRQNLDDKNAVRQNDFRPDPTINPRYSASLKDYARSGFDRGHMAPAEDFRKFPDQMSESFYLSNMIPQNSENNRGIWAMVEKNTRYWANKYEQVLVVTGPIYYGGKSLGYAGRVPVPTHIYKIVYSPRENKGLAIILPNMPVDKNMLKERFLEKDPSKKAQYDSELQGIKTIAFAKKVTGINFFPKLDPSVKQTLPTDWMIFNR